MEQCVPAPWHSFQQAPISQNHPHARIPPASVSIMHAQTSDGAQAVLEGTGGRLPTTTTQGASSQTRQQPASLMDFPQQNWTGIDVPTLGDSAPISQNSDPRAQCAPPATDMSMLLQMLSDAMVYQGRPGGPGAQLPMTITQYNAPNMRTLDYAGLAYAQHHGPYPLTDLPEPPSGWNSFPALIGNFSG